MRPPSQSCLAHCQLSLRATAILLLLLTGWDAALGCQDSGMCSLSHVKPWLGALDTHAALLAALEARSHKREVVITIFTESWVEITAQQWASMARLGMGHILALGVPGRSACDSLARVVPSIGCGWLENTTATYWPDVPLWQVWLVRHMIAARIVRAGWNVLAMDADVIFASDPYRYLKRPPFSDYQVIVHQIGSWGLNCGVYYIQNSGPSSPSVYFLSEVTDRALRHKDDSYKWLRQQGYVDVCIAWDQQLFNDVFFTMLVGRAVLGWTGVKHCRMSSVPQDEVRSDSERVEAAFQSSLKSSQAQDYAWFDLTTHSNTTTSTATASAQSTDSDSSSDVAPVWLPAAHGGVGGFTAQTVNIRIPTSSGGTVSDALPGPHSGPPLPRGPLSSMWQETLASAHTQPLWPDTADTSSSAQVTAQHTELLEVRHRMLLAPHFLISAWAEGGHRGLWTNHTVYSATADITCRDGRTTLTPPPTTTPTPTPTPTHSDTHTHTNTPHTDTNTVTHTGIGEARRELESGMARTGIGVNVGATQQGGLHSLGTGRRFGPPWFHSIGSHRMLTREAARQMYGTGHLDLPPRVAAVVLFDDVLGHRPMQRVHEQPAAGTADTHTVAHSGATRALLQEEHLNAVLPHVPLGSVAAPGRRALGYAKTVNVHGGQGNGGLLQHGVAGGAWRVIPNGTVLAHLTAIPFSPHLTKISLLRYTPGLFDREVHLRAREVAGRGPYLSSTPSRPVPRLIAYHPAIPLHLAHNMTAFQVLLRGLAQVAVLLNRTVLWPDIPCAARWISPEGPQGLRTLPYPGSLQTHAQPYGRLGLQRCFNQRYSESGCVEEGRGMLEAEYSELLSTLQPNIQAAHTYHPQPTNTVLWLTRTPTHDTHDDVTTHADTHADSALSAARAGRLLRVWWGWAAAAPAGVGGAAASAGAEVDSTADLLSVTLRVSSSDVLRVCEGREEQPVLYVAHPLEVVWSDTDTHTKQAYESFQSSCAALGAGYDRFSGPHSFHFDSGRVVT